MKAIILAGGIGKRLRPLTLSRPKGLLPLINKPMITYLLDSLPDDIDQVVIAGRYKIGMYRDFFKDNDYSFEITVSEEPEPLGTGGALKFCENYALGESDVLVFNGDVISSLNLTEFIRFYRTIGGMGAIALASVPDPSRYGMVDLNEDKYICKFDEKPKIKKAKPGSKKSDQAVPTAGEEKHLINAGTYIFSTEIFSHIPGEKKISIEREIFPDLLQYGISGFVTDGHWIDAGTARDYIDAHHILMDDPGAFKISGQIPEVGPLRKKFPETEIEGPVVIGTDAAIGKGSIIDKYTSIGSNVNIGEGCKIRNSIIMDNSIIGNGTQIKDSIIGYSSKVGSNCKISNYYISADKSKIEDGTLIK